MLWGPTVEVDAKSVSVRVTGAAAPNVFQLVRLEGDSRHWRGPIWSFQSAAGCPIGQEPSSSMLRMQPKDIGERSQRVN